MIKTKVTMLKSIIYAQIIEKAKNFNFTLIIEPISNSLQVLKLQV